MHAERLAEIFADQPSSAAASTGLPVDFRETLLAQEAERPLAAWLAAGLSILMLAAWGWWLLTADLPDSALSPAARMPGHITPAHLILRVLGLKP